MTQISTLTACLMGIVTCTSVEDLNTASAMEDEVICCGECEKLLHEDIKNVDALPIDGDILVGFGFEKLCDNYYYSKEDTFVMAQDNQLDVMDFFYNDKYGESASLGDIAYMHELQQALHEERNFIGDFNIEWKGVEQ